MPLTHYLRSGYLYIYGGMLILGGGLAVLIEFLINLTFQIHETLFWSFYPMVAGIVLGLMLIVIASASLCANRCTENFPVIYFVIYKQPPAHAVFCGAGGCL